MPPKVACALSIRTPSGGPERGCPGVGGGAGLIAATSNRDWGRASCARRDSIAATGKAAIVTWKRTGRLDARQGGKVSQVDERAPCHRNGARYEPTNLVAALALIGQRVQELDD